MPTQGTPSGASWPTCTRSPSRHGVALWDVLHSCERQGSLDSAIRAPQPNDFEGLFARCPAIGRVLFNGAAAERMFMLYGAAYLAGREWARLPSTSPAYTLPYERKLAQWREALTARSEIPVGQCRLQTEV